MSHRDHPPLDSLLEHRTWVRAVARRLLRDEHAAEDLAQEAWTRALRSPPDPERDPKPWLRRVLKNAASNMRRGDSRRTQREAAWREQREQRTPGELVAEAEQHKRLVSHVLELEEPFKTTLVLRFYEGLGPTEIAERLDVPVGTVHSRLARAVERLKQRLDSEEQGDRKAWIAALLPLTGLERFAPAPAAGVASTSFAGILIMTLTKPNVALLALLLLGTLVGGGFWLVSGNDSEPTDVGTSLEAARADGPDVEAPELETHGAPKALAGEAAPRAARTDAVAPAGIVRGRVLAADGTELVGAEVRVLPGTSNGLHDEDDPDPRVRPVKSGAKGQFEIDTRGLREPRLLVRAPGHMPAALSLVGRAAGSPIDVRLGAPWKLAVHVADARGLWPAGTSVHVLDTLDGGFERAVDPKRQEFWATLDEAPEDGPAKRTVAIDSHAPVRLTVWPPKGLAAVPPSRIVSHPEAEAAFDLVASARLDLRMSDAAGKRLPASTRASIWVGKLATQQTTWSMSGRIRAYGMDSRLAPGTYDVAVQSKGFAPWRSTFTVREPGERHVIEARLQPDLGTVAYGRLLVRLVPGATASKRVLAMAGDISGKAYVSGIEQHVVLARRTDGDLKAWRTSWRSDWAETSPDVLADGRLDMQLAMQARHETSMPVGTYDLYVAERATGRAALVRGVRVFGDQTNEIDVHLEPGTVFRLPDLVSRDGAWTGLTIRAGALGEIPPIEFQHSGYSAFLDPVGLRYLTDAPVRDVVLGPFPAAEIEVIVTPKEGAPRVIKVRGASAPKKAKR